MKEGIIIASFGTSFEDTLKACIQPIEDMVRAAFKDRPVRRAFTSNMIIKKHKERDGIHIHTVEEAIKDMVHEGIHKIHVQPLHIIPGFEYDKIQRAVKVANHQEGVEVSIGLPLLYESHHYDQVIEVITQDLKEEEDRAYLFMGHGTDHPANACYSMLQAKLNDIRSDIYLANVEGYPELDDRLEAVKAYKHVTLKPFMLVAGDHARNDMAGEDEDSFKSQLQALGLETDCLLEGLGQMAGIQEIFLNRVKESLEA